jgi:hypothetical protein
MNLLCYVCSLLTCLGLSVVECVSVVRNERGFAKVAIIHVGHSIAVLFYMGLAEKCFLLPGITAYRHNLSLAHFHWCPFSQCLQSRPSASSRGGSDILK